MGDTPIPYRNSVTYCSEAQDLLYAFERALAAQPALTLFEASGKTYRVRIERVEPAARSEREETGRDDHHFTAIRRTTSD